MATFGQTRKIVQKILFFPGMLYIIRKLHPSATKRIRFDGTYLHSYGRNLAQSALTSKSKIPKVVGRKWPGGGAKLATLHYFYTRMTYRIG